MAQRMTKRIATKHFSITITDKGIVSYVNRRETRKWSSTQRGNLHYQAMELLFPQVKHPTHFSYFVGGKQTGRAPKFYLYIIPLADAGFPLEMDASLLDPLREVDFKVGQRVVLKNPGWVDDSVYEIVSVCEAYGSVTLKAFSGECATRMRPTEVWHVQTPQSKLKLLA